LKTVGDSTLAFSPGMSAPLGMSKSIGFAGQTERAAAVKFGGDTLRISSKSAGESRPIGVWQALRTLFSHITHSDNRLMAKGMIYHYGCHPLVLLPMLTLAGPIGWALMVPALPLGWVMSKRGGQMIEKMKLDPKIQQGPLHTVDDIKKLLDNLDKTPDAPKAIVDKLKLLLDQLFPDNNTKVASARDSLKKLMDGKVFNLLNRLALVRMEVSNKFSGKLLRGLDKTACYIPFKPLRLPLRIASLVLQGLMILCHPNILKKGAIKAARHIRL
jgi:hypothetical protein